MIRVGLTGNIGAGKTLIAEILNQLGVPVYNSDQRAKYLMIHDDKLVSAIKQNFGHVYLPDGSLNKGMLAEIIFNDQDKLKLINTLVHPVVEADFTEWCNKYRHLPYIIKETAILFETGNYRQMDYNVYVFAPEELRIKRVMKRDRVDKTKVLKRIKNQLKDYQKVALADFLIINDGSVPVVPQVLNLHKFFLKQR